MPDIKFVNSPKSEKLRYSSTESEVRNGWFANHGFLVVPSLRSDIPKEIQVIFPAKFEYHKTDVAAFAAEWARVESRFWEELDHYLPEARKMHSQVSVDIGVLGTVSSSYWTSSHYYLRADRSVADLAAMIINHVLYEGRKNLGITWTKREALMDFIMTRPVMAQLLPQFDPIFHQLAKVPKAARIESEEYLKTLGIVPSIPDFALKSGKIFIKGSAVQRELTKLEKVVFKKMIEKKGEILTYDEIADSVWGEGEFKSFWAINKIVGRLRLKLAQLVSEKVRLESVRGEGYILR